MGSAGDSSIVPTFAARAGPRRNPSSPLAGVGRVRGGGRSRSLRRSSATACIDSNAGEAVENVTLPTPGDPRADMKEGTVP